MLLNRQSLRYRINLSVALTLLAVTVVFGTALTVYEIQRRHAAIQQIELTLNDLTAQYREELGNEIFAAQIIAVQATLTDIMKRKNVLSISTYDESGALLASTDEAAPGRLSSGLMVRLPASPDSAPQRWNGQSVLTFTSPIVAYGEPVGYWRINYSLATMEHQTLEIVFIFAALILSLAALFGLFLNSILKRFVLNPVYMLRNVMQHIRTTDNAIDPKTGRAIGYQRLDRMIQAFDDLSDDLILSPATDDEIGSLAYSFRQMLFALKNAYSGIRTDALTGLHNRMKLDEALEDETNRARRYHSGFAIIMLDIDNFKKVNDTYGHLAGDEVLKRVADLIKESLRKTDTPGRWGGEEFLVLLPQQDGSSARIVAEKLRVAIEAADFPDFGVITASFGVTDLTPDDTVATLVKRADEALYRAKELGKNRVEEGPAKPFEARRQSR
jgi:diguanylate cyclase (GGDEF)-like protein